MPHRLRRIIGVNIQRPLEGGGGPSRRIAVLDTRGAVMAVGRNGVGKTSFLRLIPLFYGALPSRILRGSGHTRMIRYMLPHPSSAVVYEYERESEQDVRCAVMHASPDDAIDAPVFHIIAGEFQEAFFVDALGNFLTREEFKPHVENMGTEVSPQLTHADYRAVILNSAGPTKNQGKLRRLAAVHSLAPGSLAGLDDIAAALGPEAISFQAMQQLVVDQVTAEMSSENKGGVRQLRKNEADIARWLDGHDHLTRLRDREPDARNLARAASELREIDEAMRELRRAARDLLAVRQQDAVLARGNKQRRMDAAAVQEQVLLDALNAARNRADGDRTETNRLEDELNRRRERAHYFSTLAGEGGVQRLEQEQSQEPALRAEKERVALEHSDLEQRSNGITRDFGARREEVRRLRAAEEANITAEQSRLADARTASQKALRTEEETQELALQAPARLALILAEVSTLDTVAGELGAELKNPQETPETAARIEELRDQQLPAARDVAAAAQRAFEQESDKFRETERLRAERLREQERVQLLVQAAEQSVRDLQARLSPPKDSLLAHLRGWTAPDRSAVARVIDQSLLERTDLQPQEAEGTPAGDPTTVAVGSLVLRVGDVPEPEWLEQASARDQLQAAQAQLAALREQTSTADDQLTKANSEVDAATTALARARATRDARAGDVSRLEQQLRLEQENRVRERVDAKARIQAAIKQNADARQALLQEQAELQQQHDRARATLRETFRSRRDALEHEDAAARRLLDERRERARKGAEQAIGALDAEEAQKLTAAGLDPIRLAALVATLQRLEDRLKAISHWRGEVTAWQEFRDGPLAKMAELEEQVQQAQSKLAVSRKAVEDADAAIGTHREQSRKEIDALEQAAERAELDAERLEALLAQELRVIADAPGKAAALQSWTTDNLAAEVGVRKAKLAATVQTADELISTLRRQMQAGTYPPVIDWYDRKTEEYEPLLANQPNHIVTMHKARMLCEWNESAASNVIHSHNADLSAVLAAASEFVNYLDVFDRLVATANTKLRTELARVRPFPSFRDLSVTIRSAVRDLDYVPALRAMKAKSDSLVSLHRLSASTARNTELADRETVALIRQFRGLLSREGGISFDLSQLVRLECELTINGKNVKVENAESFKAHASNGNTGMIVAMFLMGFAGIVRRNARAPARLTWIVDELGRFDTPNLQAFLSTLDENAIDVISAQPDPNPSVMDLFDGESRFAPDGRISTTRLSADTWEDLDVPA